MKTAALMLLLSIVGCTTDEECYDSFVVTNISKPIKSCSAAGCEWVALVSARTNIGSYTVLRRSVDSNPYEQGVTYVVPKSYCTMF